MAFHKRDAFHRCLCVTGTRQGGGHYRCRATGQVGVPTLSRPQLLCVHNAGDYPLVSGRVSSV